MPVWVAYAMVVPRYTHDLVLTPFLRHSCWRVKVYGTDAFRAILDVRGGKAHNGVLAVWRHPWAIGW